MKSVHIAWTPNPPSQRVNAYIVRRDGQIAGTTQVASFSLQTNRRSVITVTAKNATGESKPSKGLTI